MLGEEKPFVQIRYRAFGPVVQMSFKEKSLQPDGRRAKTDHNSSSLAFGSGELKHVGQT